MGTSQRQWRGCARHCRASDTARYDVPQGGPMVPVATLNVVDSGPLPMVSTSPRRREGLCPRSVAHGAALTPRVRPTGD